MDKEVVKLLADIKICIDNIDQYIGDKKVFDEYQKIIICYRMRLKEI